MSDYNLQVYTADGRNAINGLYNSYYIAKEGTLTLQSETDTFFGVPFTRAYAYIGAAGMVPNYTSTANRQPIFLLKNTNKTAIGGYTLSYVNGSYAVKVLGGSVGGAFDYAIAIPELGPTTTDKYGLQMLDETGTKVIFDSRRTSNLLFKGIGTISDGFITDGSTATVSTDFDYFSAPMAVKSVYTPVGSSGGLYQYAIGTVCMKGNGGRTLTFTSYLAGGQIANANYGNGGSSAVNLLFFSKA